MKKVREEIYSQINNNIYETNGNTWWRADSLFYQMKVMFNPVRVNYSKTVLNDQLKITPNEKSALEVGCGGGLLCEEIAKMGFKTTGIDPSKKSIHAAIQHNKENGLKINYIQGYGESLPFADNFFDTVFCCDVLEHVQDLPKVISEISRVLKNGGVFIYDTFNRTFLSKIGAIKILQEWKRWAIMPPDLHVWEMFIKPREIKTLLKQNQLDWKEHQGITPNISYLKILHYLRKRALGKLTYEEFSNKFRMVEGRSSQIMYIGYALKK